MNMAKNTENQTLLPEPTIRRLPWYLSYVRMLDNLHVEYVSSTQISKELNVQSSQIAKDLSFLNIRGKTRMGYEVSRLVVELEAFLGFNSHHDAVVIGTGSLGAALMQDRGLEHYGLNIVAGFDVRPDVVGKRLGGLPVLDISELESWQREHHVSIAILTVPVESAQETADLLIASGIKALWNFTPYRIKAPDDVVIANTSIYAHLAIIYNRMHNTNNDTRQG
ncbi:MAG: redox-sensing transcriptional repressor Rex [Muribaculaceae bacterium]|nr:redox-sensing transcriptional repressor Rex [Muribaculaceae bacterium]